MYSNGINTITKEQYHNILNDYLADNITEEPFWKDATEKYVSYLLLNNDIRDGATAFLEAIDGNLIRNIKGNDIYIKNPTCSYDMHGFTELASPRTRVKVMNAVNVTKENLFTIIQKYVS